MKRQTILERMQAIPKYPSQSGHQDADDLLIAYIRSLAGGSDYAEVEEEAEQVIAAYDSIEKWYA